MPYVDNFIVTKVEKAFISENYVYPILQCEELYTIFVGGSINKSTKRSYIHFHHDYISVQHPNYSAVTDNHNWNNLFLYPILVHVTFQSTKFSSRGASFEGNHRKVTGYY